MSNSAVAHTSSPIAALSVERASVRDYASLLKLGIMRLVLITTLGAMAFAARGWPSTLLVLETLTGMALVSGGSSAFNHYYDRDIDRLMARTASRPVASGRIPAEHALLIGLVMGLAGVVELATLVNAETAVYGLGGYICYALVYTVWLKRRTPHNIVVGGAAGSFPPLAGWAAVEGHAGLSAVALAVTLFLWTPPHFFALSLLIHEEYAKAGVPMLPTVSGLQATGRQILVYTVLLVVSAFGPVALGTLGVTYAVIAAIAGAWFVGLAWRLSRAPADRALARRTFLYSIAYITALFAAMGVDRAVNQLF